MAMYLSEMTGIQAAMICGGVATFLIAAFVLWGSNWQQRGTNEKPEFSFPGVGVVSEPTRLLAGYFGILLAYHLVVWSLPARTTPLQFPRARWWIVLVVGVGAVGGSLALDLGERRERAGKDGDGEGGSGGG